MAEIRLRFAIAATPAAVYANLTTREGLADWWTREVTAEPVVGSLATFRFNERGAVFRMRVERLEADREVAWICEAGHPEWVGTRLRFRLAPAEGGTRLDFEHTDWKRDDGILPLCRYDWDGYLHSLKLLSETGRGTPAIV